MGMPYFKAFSEGILRGSLANADDIVQLIWLKLLAMANETRNRDGYLHYAPGRPFTLSFIAMTCNVGMEELLVSLGEFENDIRDGEPRIKTAEDGTIYLTNFWKYQSKPERLKTKEDSITRAKLSRDTRRELEGRLSRLVGELNRLLPAVRYTVSADLEVVDSQTGQIVTEAELAKHNDKVD